MNELYHATHFQFQKNLEEFFSYLSSSALSQPLHEVENSILKMLLRMGKNLLEVFLKNKGTCKKEYTIDSVGEKLPFHSIKQRKYSSIFGVINISRAYFWKEGSKGLFDLDKELNLPAGKHSYLLDSWIQSRVTEEPYEEAINSISKLFDLRITKRVVQQITVSVSQEVDNYYKQKNEFEGEGSCLVVQADCKGVIMIPKERSTDMSKEEFTRRAKGVSKIGIRKDAVVTTDYSINPVSRTPKELLEGLMCINSNKKKENKSEKKRIIKNKQVSGTMYGKDKAFKNLADRLEARDSEGKKPIFILIDGARSLEKGFREEFEKRGWKSRIQGCCLDIVHATEYLWDASTAMYGETGVERVPWVKRALLKVLNSNVKSVIKELRKEIKNETNDFIIRRLTRSANYFENHIHMMDYKKYLEKGYPIASGAIEGACNTLVKDRTDRSGMQWTKKGADAVINLRSVKCNKDWDAYWNYYVEEQGKKLYGMCGEMAA